MQNCGWATSRQSFILLSLISLLCSPRCLSRSSSTPLHLVNRRRERGAENTVHQAEDWGVWESEKKEKKEISTTRLCFLTVAERKRVLRACQKPSLRRKHTNYLSSEVSPSQSFLAFSQSYFSISVSCFLLVFRGPSTSLPSPQHLTLSPKINEFFPPSHDISHSILPPYPLRTFVMCGRNSYDAFGCS